MFYGQRVVDIPDGLPKWSGINQQSDLIEDSPQETIKAEERRRQKMEDEEKGKGTSQKKENTD